MLINGLESIFSFNATVNQSILLLLAARERLMFGGTNPLPVVNNNLAFRNCGKNKMQSARTSSPVYVVCYITSRHLVYRLLMTVSNAGKVVYYGFFLKL